MNYNRDSLKKAYEAVGVSRGRVIMLKPDLRWLGAFEPDSREALLAAHFEVLAELIDFNEGTLIFPTASTSLCNTDTPFDPLETPSETGLLSEYLRQRPGAVRSFHPFISYTAIGRQAEYLCRNVSRHAFGPNTPEARALELDALDVSLGTHPRFTCSMVHHVEHLMAVPYRYTKEFHHPVVRDCFTVYEDFYMHVWYRECDLDKDQNVAVFENFVAQGGRLAETELGRGRVYAYSCRDFYERTIDLFTPGHLRPGSSIRPRKNPTGAERDTVADSYKLDHIGMAVSDLAKARKFYADCLGLAPAGSSWWSATGSRPSSSGWATAI